MGENSLRGWKPKKKTWETDGRKRRKEKGKGKGRERKKRIRVLYFHAVLIICSDQGVFMV